MLGTRYCKLAGAAVTVLMYIGMQQVLLSSQYYFQQSKITQVQPQVVSFIDNTEYRDTIYLLGANTMVQGSIPFETGIIVSVLLLAVVVLLTAFYLIANRKADLRKTKQLLKNEIAAREKAEQSLKDRANLDQIFLDCLPPVGMLLRPHTREIVACNKAGLEVGAVPGKTCYETWGQRDTPCPWCKAQKVWKTGEAQHLETEDAGRFWDAHWIPVADDLYLHYAYDITERKQAEQELRAAEANLKNTFDISPGLICVANVNSGSFEECNPAVTTILGFSVEEFTSTPYMELIHPDDRQKTIDEITKQLQGSLTANFENRYRCKDGSYRWLAWQTTAVDENGKVHAVATDITDRRRAEEKLRAAEANLKNTFDFSPSLICVADANAGIFKECNPAVTRMLGFSVEEFTSTPFIEFIHPDDRRRTADVINKQLRGNPVANFENRYRCKDGSYRWLAWQATAADENGKVHAVAADITDRKRAEKELQKHRDNLEELVEARTHELDSSRAQLQRAERLASVGTLAAGIAHEINNPLGMMMLGTDAALTSLKNPQALEELLKENKRQVERCERIVKGVLDFAGHRSTEKYPLGLNEIIRHAMDYTQQYASTHTVEVTAQLADELTPILGNSTELEQVVVNLVHNGVQACNDGGEVSISTCNINGEIRLVVGDDGCGMTPEQIKHAFDPFYTTRSGKGGTGLGLSTVHGIIEGHHGSIEITSEIDKGTTYTITFPKHNSKESEYGEDTDS